MEAQISLIDPQLPLWRYVRNSFDAAGQWSYSTPPSQDQDSFLQLHNTQPVTRGALERRWGLRPVSQVDVGAVRLGEFQNPASQQRSIYVADLNKAVLFSEEDFTTMVDPLFTYSAGATTLPRFLVSREHIYTTNGIDLLKHTGASGGVQHKWGVAAESNDVTQKVGPKNGAVQSLTGLGATWTNSINVFLTDGVYTTVALTPLVNTGGMMSINSTSKILNTSNYTMNVTDMLDITGIQIDVILKQNISTIGGTSLTVQLNKAGIAGIQRTNTYAPGLPLVDTTISFGGPSDLWSMSWIPGDFNNTGFGASVFVANQDTVNPITVSVDSIKVTLFYQAPFVIASVSSAGAVTLLNGRKYAIVFKNAEDGALSDLGAFSASTGAITNKEISLSALSVSPDSQVTRKLLVATADGGDETKLYLVTELDNATTTYIDNTAELDLLNANILLETDDEGTEHGVSGNTPPPLGTIVAKHRGRLYMLIGSTIYYTKSLDELTTSTGLICGRYEDSWPGDFQLDVSDLSETGKALFSDGTTLYIGTERNIRRLDGDGPDNFTSPSIHFNQVGVVNQEVLQVVYNEGTPVAAMWLTPDLKVMMSDFNTYQNVGDKITDVLATINSDALDGAEAIYFGSGVYGFYALAVPTGTNTQNDTILVYDLNRHKWHVWNLPTDAYGLLFNITANGRPRLLIGGSANSGG